MRFLTSKGVIEITSAGFIKEDSLFLPEFLDRAIAYHQAGHLQEAESIYQSILKIQPQHSDALHLRGIIANQMGKFEVAVNLIEEALKVNPNAHVFNNCGEAYKALHKYDLALDCYNHALAINPYFAEAKYNMGLALHELGHFEEAIVHYEQALVINPHFLEALNNLGVVLQESGRRKDAVTYFERAIAINSYFPEALNNMGVVLQISGKPIEAIIHHQKAMRLCPKELAYHITFTKCLSGLQITHANDALKKDIVKIFSVQGVNHHELAFASASIIKYSPVFQKLVAVIDCADSKISFLELLDAGFDKIYSEPLFLAILKKTIIRDRLIERFLTIIRRSLLHMAIETEFSIQASPQLVAFIYALAQQCYFNEYIYAITETEAIEIKKLTTLVKSFAESTDNSQKLLIAILACYTPLCSLNRDKIFTHLIEKNAGDEIVELITQQIVEPNEEKALRNKINAIGVINNKISQKVRAQYEENPYPRWLSVHKLKGESVVRTIRRLFPHILLEQIRENQSPKILVAGCGTGQQVITKSLEFEASEVLGVDISLSSLSYAQRKARELEITNVDFIHADLLNLHFLNKTFDIIECIGVLHHMNDPVKGWQALVNLLKPGALMRIGLYSEIARKDIATAQSFIAEKGYKANPNGIRECRQDIFGITNNSVIGNVARITDFYTLSETRDLLFHVCENRFNLLQIAEIIGDLDLTFLGFEFDNPLEKERYLNQFPDDPSATSLHNWHIYEQNNTNTFIGLYLFWVQKCA